MKIGARVFTVLTSLMVGGGAAYYVAWQERNACRFSVMAVFDGYAYETYDSLKRVRKDYAVSIPVIRPTEQNGLIRVTEVLETNGLGIEPAGYQLAIGKAKIRTDAGELLVKGSTYRFSFKKRWFDSRGTYRMKIAKED